MSLPAEIWANPVATWLETTLPRETGERDGWNDYAITAYQFGCAALVSLGRARRVPWGAERLETPIDTVVPPRWDDVCIVVLKVMRQRREIEYRMADGTRYNPPLKPGQFQVRRIYPEGQEPLVPDPTIGAAHGCLPAYVQADDLALLEILGLVSEGVWAAEAETVLWRIQPRGWDMQPTADPRFDTGLERCLKTMPEDVVETLHDLVDITPEEITASVERMEAANADLIAKHPAQGKFDRTVTPERQFRTLTSIAEHNMDDLFFQSWRLESGWLENDTGALNIFHDPLAKAMRAASLEAMDLSLPQEMPQ